MIPRECKRLAEVDFPIAEVSRHAVRDRSMRHGHPSTLHSWWARRPLASCRAMLLALLLPDPCDSHCPKGFCTTVGKEIGDLASFLTEEKTGSDLLVADLKSDLRSSRPKVRQLAEAESSHRRQVWQSLADTRDWIPARTRSALLHLLAQGSAWEWSSEPLFLRVVRNLVKAAHGDEAPLVVDPFAGGGSIPLEALRLGCEAFASDLNPVACLILKTMLEDIPRHGPKLAEELRRISREIKAAAEQELADLYPLDPDGATPIAYLWARTVRCEAPSCGAEIPLMRSFWLCNKVERKWALRHRVELSEGRVPHVEFDVFKPKADQVVHGGTVDRAKVTCLCCGAVLPPDRVRSQLAKQRGGADVVFDEQGKRTGGARMTAVVTLKPGKSGRHYRLSTDADYEATHRAQMRVAAILEAWEHGGSKGLCPVPDEPISLNELRRISVPIYGMLKWGDLFTARQKAALVELARQLVHASSHSANVVSTTVAMCIDKVAMQNNSGCRWKATGESLMDSFGRQALPMVWDFAESSPICGSTGDIRAQAKWLVEIIDNHPFENSADVHLADATDHPLPDQAAGVWFTDPPYYDAVPYAHLADFFFVWLKRTIPDNSLLGNSLKSGGSTTPKHREIVVDRPHRLSTSKKNAKSYEQRIAKAFAEGRRTLRDEGIGSVVFAHKTTEGWEALLAGMIGGGWTITGSWPIATEMTERLNARKTASLATSVHLVCRPRPDDAPVGDWADVLRDLPVRVGAWMERLQGEGVRGADLVFACIGPALEIFSRCRTVETAEGREVGLPEYLEKVWEAVSRSALQQVLGTEEAQARNGLAGALEEDARLTALFLWTFQSTESITPPPPTGTGDEDDEESASQTTDKGFSLPFDMVRRFAQPMGIDLDLWTGRIIGQEKGVVRLLPVAERASDLFGEDGAGVVADWIESEQNADTQTLLFPELADAPRLRSSRSVNQRILDRDTELQAIDATTLDRVHAAMLLQASGHTNALRALIGAEQDRGPNFLRLSNALSALYPRNSEEKRHLDAMLLAVPK